MEKGDEAQEWQRERGGGGIETKRRDQCKNGIMIFLFTRATLGTPASKDYLKQRKNGQRNTQMLLKSKFMSCLHSTVRIMSTCVFSLLQ